MIVLYNYVRGEGRRKRDEEGGERVMRRGERLIKGKEGYGEICGREWRERMKKVGGEN